MFVALIVLVAFIIIKKRNERLTEVRKAYQLASSSVKPSSGNDGDEYGVALQPMSRGRGAYDAFQTDADIIID